MYKYYSDCVEKEYEHGDGKIVIDTMELIKSVADNYNTQNARNEETRNSCRSYDHCYESSESNTYYESCISYFLDLDWNNNSLPTVGIINKLINIMDDTDVHNWKDNFFIVLSYLVSKHLTNKQINDNMLFWYKESLVLYLKSIVALVSHC